MSEDTGTIRAKAVRIRGSPESAYPFMKGSAVPWQPLPLLVSKGQQPEATDPAEAAPLPEIRLAERQEMLDPSGIEE